MRGTLAIFDAAFGVGGGLRWQHNTCGGAATLFDGRVPNVPRLISTVWGKGYRCDP